jgi:hypothetical protein
MGGDPALSTLLKFVYVDERAHHDLFKRFVQMYLEYDRPATLEQLRRVMNNFNMPAIDDLVDGKQRVAAIKSLRIFDEDLYYREVYMPILEALGVQRSEMRNRLPNRKSAVNGTAG